MCWGFCLIWSTPAYKLFFSLSWLDKLAFLTISYWWPILKRISTIKSKPLFMLIKCNNLTAILALTVFSLRFLFLDPCSFSSFQPCFCYCRQKSVWGPQSATSAFSRQQDTPILLPMYRVWPRLKIHSGERVNAMIKKNKTIWLSVKKRLYVNRILLAMYPGCLERLVWPNKGNEAFSRTLFYFQPTDEAFPNCDIL